MSYDYDDIEGNPELPFKFLLDRDISSAFQVTFDNDWTVSAAITMPVEGSKYGKTLQGSFKAEVVAISPAGGMFPDVFDERKRWAAVGHIRTGDTLVELFSIVADLPREMYDPDHESFDELNDWLDEYGDTLP